MSLLGGVDVTKAVSGAIGSELARSDFVTITKAVLLYRDATPDYCEATNNELSIE